MTGQNMDFQRQMAAAQEAMDKHKVALSVLAQGENSPYMTDELRAQLAEAEKRLVKYRTVDPT